MKLLFTSLIYILFIAFVFTSELHSQSTLYMPLEFQNAYDNDTRSFDGNPGSEYWQNHSDYMIDANINIAERTITAHETIIYYNDSPDTLDKIVIRLYQNINKPGNVRDFAFDEKYFTRGIDIKSIEINDREYSQKDTSLNYTGTNLVIKGLQIMPDSRTDLKFSWEFEVPKENIVRMGAYDSSVFFIAYWYPQVAVYDDIYGWDILEYTGRTEFYNDFNNYDVTITVPNTIGLWATGELVNAEKIYSPHIYSRYNLARSSEKIINIISGSDYSEKKPIFNNKSQANSWHFRAAEVPDFTFGLSDHYLWDGRKVFDGVKNVFVSAVYDPKSVQFYSVCDAASQTVEMLSHDLPGMPFPFPKMTVFNGGGGMESPMMVNMGDDTARIWMVYTAVHEVVHSYFPFYMGINERRYAWMDEGWTQMLSEYIQYALDTTIDFRKRNVKRYLDYAGKFDEVPMMFPSYMVSGGFYGCASYFRPDAALNILKDLLDGQSKDMFKRVLQEYISRWNGSHPTPYDFFFTFDNAAGENLDWFWGPWFFDQGYPDLDLDSIVIENDSIKILVDKGGSLPIPILLEVKASDGSVDNIYYSADIWKDGADAIWITESTDGKKIKRIELGNKFIPDADPSDNVWIAK